MSNAIHMQDYTYSLPPDKIATHPISTRDESKLLVYQKGKIQHTAFKSLVDFLPQNSFLFFNDTKVIPARIHFQKDTGAEIEIFLLSPVKPSTLMADAMVTNKTCTWQCTIGNLKRWKGGQPLLKEVGAISLHASLIDRNTGVVEFSWNTGQSFAEIITAIGVTPLPPYIKREATSVDVNRYQTVYSHYEGAVAAPTAGLHFTDHILESLHRKGIERDFLTLHVSAGTFQPVKAENALEHTMHHEQIIVTRKSIENLLKSNQFIVAVGTTSMRTLESLYWYGVKLLENAHSDFMVNQDDPYQKRVLPSSGDALLAILSHMDKRNLDSLTGSTSIFIYPGYAFKICNALITNFHLPASTLILLVAAFVGDDWEKIYNEALHNNYRFLSYGDSSLLIP
jgi:S-adenosylmethionine:tRNA ribosyltransferase-isomerase